MGLLSSLEDFGGGLLGMHPGQPAAPQPQSAAPQGPYQPSWWDTLQGVLFNGQSPADAAMAARQRNYALQRQQILLDALHNAPPDRQIAMMLNPDKEGEAMASHDTSMTMKAGETRNNGVGGANYTAPVIGFDPTSGRGYTQTVDATNPTGQSLGGDYKTDANGIVTSGRTGVVGGVAVPQVLPPGSTPSTFTPSVPGAPAAAPPGAAPGASSRLSAQNARDILASILPGAKVTSGYRTPGHNAAVGGVPDSMHTRGDGQALDFVPPPGTNFDQFRADLQRRGVPATELLNEGDHIHWGWGAKGQQTASAAPSSGSGWNVGAPVGQTHIIPPGDPAYAGFPAGSILQRDAKGEVSVVQKPEYDPQAKTAIRDHVLSSDEYKQAQAAMAAYHAMIANSRTMTGPSAYSMLDTFARAINPGAVARPTVIETIEKNLGLPARFVGSLESAYGKGNLPPQVRQQIIDAVVPFAQAHWDQANALNQANANLARSHKFDPADVTAPLEARPERYSIASENAGVPQPAQRKPGQVYNTPRGQMRWTGTGWLPAGGH